MSRICALGAILIALAMGGSTAVAEAAATPPAAGSEAQGPPTQSTTRPNEDGGQAATEPGASRDEQAADDPAGDDHSYQDERGSDRQRHAGRCDEQGDDHEPDHQGDDRGGCEELGGSEQQADGAQPDELADDQASGQQAGGAGSDESADDQASGQHAEDQGSDDHAAGETPPAVEVAGVSATPLEQVQGPAPSAGPPSSGALDPRPPGARSPASRSGGRRSSPRRRSPRSQRPRRATPKQGSRRAPRKPASTEAGTERRGSAAPPAATPGADVAHPRSRSAFDRLPGPGVATAVPNLVIERFKIPIFLLPIYQAAGIEYGVRWEVLAAINEVETNYGRNLNVSSAGAMGWMQFIPSSWRAFGVDGNDDGRKDPYNPVDAIFAAANYLERAGAEKDLRRAIFAYNHADWYVDMVLERARAIAAIPADLVGSLTGLTEGRFPVAAGAHYGGATSARATRRRVRVGQEPAPVVEGDGRRAGVDIFSRRGALVVAVNDGVVKRIGRSRTLGRYVVLQDVYGNRFTYSRMGRLSRVHRELRPRARSVPTTSRGRSSRSSRSTAHLFRLRSLRRGSRVLAGAVLGRVGTPRPDRAPHVHLGIRPAGRGAPRIDPRPILDGWRLLESTAIYRASGRNALRADSGPFSLGQVLLLPKPLLERRVLADSRIELYECGRRDVRSGQVDRRLLATLAYLAESGLSPTVSSLKCGHSFYTRSGNVSHHSSGNAVDIAALNGVPVLGHQGAGDVTDQAVRRLLALQGSLRPDQVISLLDLGAPTLAMGDHDDHIHVGFRPLFGSNRALGRQGRAVMRPRQWHDLLDRLEAIGNPRVSRRPSRRRQPRLPVGPSQRDE